MKEYYVSNVNTEIAAFEETGKIAIINNSEKEQETELFIAGEKKGKYKLKEMEMLWVNI